MQNTFSQKAANVEETGSKDLESIRSDEIQMLTELTI